MAPGDQDQLVRVFERAGLPLEQARAVLAGDQGAVLSEEPALALLASDPPGIKDIVLRSRRPISRYGASRRLDSWDREIASDEGHATLFAGGGQAVCVVPAGEAHRLSSRLEEQFTAIFDAPLATAWVRCSPRDLVHGPRGPSEVAVEDLRRLGLDRGNGFGGLLSAAQAALRAAKGRDTGGRAVVQGRRCDECGVGPGTSKHRGIDDRDAWLCGTCKSFAEWGRQKLGDERARRLRSFDDLGDGMLAFLSLDGTSVGARLAECRTVDEYAALSRALHAAFDWAELKPLLESRGVDALPVLAGGDDLLLVLSTNSGAGALATAAAVLERVGKRLAAVDSGEVGVGAGLVVTRSLGARQAFELAEALVRGSKAAARVRGAPNAAVLDFEIVGGGDILSESIERMRSGRRLRLHGHGALVLGQRPFTLPELLRVVDVAEQLDTDDRSALYAMRDAWVEEPLSGLLQAHYSLVRGREALADLLGAKDARPWAIGDVNGLFLRRVGKKIAKEPTWETAVPDLIDAIRLRDIVEGRR